MGCCLSDQQKDRVKKRMAQQLGTSHLTIENQGKEVYIRNSKQKLKYEVQRSDDFLSHHLQNEQSLSLHSSSRKIRARQILEHALLGNIMRMAVTGQPHSAKFIDFTLKAWFQRTFIDALDKAEKCFLQGKLSYNDMREQLTEEYIFELYQLGTFIKAGLLKFSTKEKQMDIPVSVVLLHSDSALYPLLQKLQTKYPLVIQDNSIVFPQVADMKSKINLLSLISSKSFIDLDNLNIQTTMDDLKFLIDTANKDFPDFKTDLENMLQGAETDCKVKWKKSGQGDENMYNASAIRRVFIKWTQTLIQRIPDVYESKEFMAFVQSKKIMADQFIFKGTVSPTTHHQVIQNLNQLLESLKCKIGTKVPREEFGLFLYDLLRCKTTRKTPQEVVDMLEKLKTISRTPSGRRFEVVRVKNRFKWATRDLLINFRYGQHLIGEVQLCVDISHEDPKVSKQIQLRHLLYEFQRGLFGPTFEMIMQYQDFTRQDIVVNMQAQGPITHRRLNSQGISGIMKRANRLCPQKHEMIAIAGDQFSKSSITFMMQGNQTTSMCNFCFKQFSLQQEFHYCYYCSIFYCVKCMSNYNKTDKELLKLTCLKQNIIQQVEKPEDLNRLCTIMKSIIVIFYREGSTASQLFIDQIVFLLSSYSQENKNIPPIYKINAGNKEMANILYHYEIQRTPTTLILDQRLEKQVTLVGCTFQDVESLIEIRENISQGLPKGLQIKCHLCNSTMSQGQSPRPDEKCYMCMNSNKIEGLKDLVRMIKSDKNDYVCSKGHLRCSYCSYLSSNEPSFYRDCTGKSYLSNKLTNDNLECSKGHKMQLIPLSNSEEKTCYKCKHVISALSGEQAGVCLKCKEYMCIDCKQTEKVSYESTHKQKIIKSIELVSHFVQNTLEEGYPCGCGKLFQRVYQSQNINEGRINLKEIMGMGAVSWTCRICEKEEEKLRLHLACFFCSYAQEINKKTSHTQICINCAIKSGILGKKPHVKVIREETEFKCSSGHPVILTSLRDRESVAFACFYCKKLSYPYSQRYECESCKIKICLECSNRNLVDGNPLTTTKVCKNDHSLKMIKQSPKLQFCSLCSIYLQDKHFECPKKECRYFLCLGCGIDLENIKKEGEIK